MKICSTCSIQGTDECDLIYDIYLSDGDSELMLTVCYLCHAMIKSHMPPMEESTTCSCDGTIHHIDECGGDEE